MFLKCVMTSYEELILRGKSISVSFRKVLIFLTVQGSEVTRKFIFKINKVHWSQHDCMELAYNNAEQRGEDKDPQSNSS